jgi:hypothetical protein
MKSPTPFAVLVLMELAPSPGRPSLTRRELGHALYRFKNPELCVARPLNQLVALGYVTKGPRPYYQGDVFTITDAGERYLRGIES